MRCFSHNIVFHTTMKMPVRSERRKIERSYTHTHTHTRLLAQRERQQINARNYTQLQGWLRKSVRNRWIEHTQVANDTLQNLQSGWRMSGWDKNEHVAKSRKQRDANIQNCKDSDNTKDCWWNFLTAQSDSGSLQIWKYELYFIKNLSRGANRHSELELVYRRL